MVSQRMSIGLDVHARSIAGCAIGEDTGEVIRRRFGYEPAAVVDWVRTFPEPAAVTYEAGPTGFGLARLFTASGIECVVAAPSKLLGVGSRWSRGRSGPRSRTWRSPANSLAGAGRWP